MTARPPAPRGARQGAGWGAALLARREAGLVAAILLVTLAVGAAAPRFLAGETLRIVALAVPLILVGAMGQMIVVVARHVDLSMGSVMAFASIVAGMIWRDLPGLPILAGVAAALVVGTGLGLVNGALVVLFRLPSIIVTLGTLSLYRGLVFVVSDARQVDPQFIPRPLIALSQTSPVFGIPWLVLIAAGVAVATHLFLAHSQVGRQVYALGSNPVAAPLRGIRAGRVTLLVFAISGALAGLAGVMYASRFGYVNPGITGQGFEFDVIAAVVVGGVSINGGSGTVAGTVLGVLLLGLVSVALPILGVTAFWQGVVTGAVIVAALLVDRAVLDRALRAGQAQERAA